VLRILIEYFVIPTAVTECITRNTAE